MRGRPRGPSKARPEKVSLSVGAQLIRRLPCAWSQSGAEGDRRLAHSENGQDQGRSVPIPAGLGLTPGRQPVVEALGRRSGGGVVARTRELWAPRSSRPSGAGDRCGSAPAALSQRGIPRHSVTPLAGLPLGSLCG